MGTFVDVSTSDSSSKNSSRSSSGYSSELSSSNKPWPSKRTPSQQNLRNLAVHQLVDLLDKQCYRKDSLDEFRRALEDPSITRRILKHYPNSRVNLVRYYQWLDKNCPNFVWRLAAKTATNACLLPSFPHEIGHVSNLRLGTMLMETGWYAESLLVLNVALQHSRTVLEKLRVMRVILLAESLSSRRDQASETARLIQHLLCQDCTIPINLVVAVHQALSVWFFESCQFELSYYHGMLALHRLDAEQCIKSSIINTYRQLAKSCIAMRRPYQANLMITQAVMWAHQCYGSSSVNYAETLEDYAFCNLAQNKNYVDLNASAMAIYRKKYGKDFNRSDVAQGNMALRLYLQNVAYRMDAKYMMKNVIDMEGNHSTALDGTDDRLRLAAKRVRALLTADQICQEVCDATGDEMDFGLNERMECLPIPVVQREFNILNINLNLL